MRAKLLIHFSFLSNEISHTSTVSIFSSIDELPSGWKKLVLKAKTTLSSSYSPYSGFQVASALRLKNGKEVVGSNQENIAYPSGLCAERVAIFSAGTNYPGEEIEAIAIIANSKNGIVDNPVTPCGSCRQVMIEIESNQTYPITVIMTGIEGEVWVSKSVANLIPFYFSSNKVNRSD